MAGPLSIRQDGRLRFPGVPRLTAAQLTQVGTFSIGVMLERVGRCVNLNDVGAKPYSSRGPIYRPIYGQGTSDRGINIGAKRTKSNLRGAAGFTSKDLRTIKTKGTAILLGRKGSNTPGVEADRGGRPVIAKTKSGKSLKFANYSAYKKALGRSGNRDLMVSGAMLRAIVVVEVTPSSVAIGFTREEETIAAANQARDPWFGLSRGDAAKVDRFVQPMLAIR